MNASNELQGRHTTDLIAESVHDCGHGGDLTAGPRETPVCCVGDQVRPPTFGDTQEPGAGTLNAPKQVLTVDELAALLRVNKKTIYDAIKNGEIPGVRKIGRVFRISKPKVLAWLAEGHGRVSPKRRRK